MCNLDFNSQNPFEEVSPLGVFQAWLQDATLSEINDPTAMAIATIGSDGYPQNRMVLCRGVNPSGVIFYTNKYSAKGQALAHNPKISALFHWKTLARQVRLVGKVRPVDVSQNQKYFSSRATISRLGAWASKQSQVLDNRKTLEDRLEQAQASHGHKEPIPCPDFWGGYEIVVEKIEFWCDGEYRLHNRFLCTKKSADVDLSDKHGWQIDRLYP